MNIYEVPSRPPSLIQSLVAVWEASVRATHLFLSDVEIRHRDLWRAGSDRQ